MRNLSAAAAVMALATLGARGDILVVDERPMRAPKRRQPVRAAKPEPTEADNERIRQAAERRARKIARQARGFS